MSFQFQSGDPKGAQRYFENKIRYSCGPKDLDGMLKKDHDFKLIDVRSQDDYEEGHIPGALSLPVEKWSSFEGLDKNTLNVVYCYSHVCYLGALAAVEFSKAGFPVIELHGGMRSWKDMDLEIEKGSDSRGDIFLNTNEKTVAGLARNFEADPKENSKAV